MVRLAVFGKVLVLAALMALAALVYRLWFPIAARLVTADLLLETRGSHGEEVRR